MRKKVYTAHLSATEVNKIAQAIQDYRNKLLNVKLQTLIERLSFRGLEIAQANIVKLDAIFTGELLDSLGVNRARTSGSRLVFFIVTDSEHAAYVEFGTGQMGKEMPYPFPFPNGVDWKYNVGKTIFQTKDGDYGWFYPLPDGTWRFTMGMESRPFMYEAALDTASEVVQIAKEIFR